MTHATTLPALYSLPEVAERYRIPVRRLRERARRREFAHVLIGRERYLTDEQLKAFIASATQPAQRDGDLAATRERVSRRFGRATTQAQAA